MFSDTRDPEPPRSHAGGQVSHPASRIAPPSRDRALYASHAGAESASAALALGGGQAQRERVARGGDSSPLAALAPVSAHSFAACGARPGPSPRRIQTSEGMRTRRLQIRVTMERLVASRIANPTQRTSPSPEAWAGNDARLAHLEPAPHSHHGQADDRGQEPGSGGPPWCGAAGRQR
jgi:hypothetical protein